MPNRCWTVEIFIFSVMILGPTLFSQAAEKGSAKEAGTAKDAYDIEAKDLTYNQDTEIYTAIGEVIIKKSGRVLKCDYAQVDHKTMIAQAQGHVEFTADGDELRGDELTVDLQKQTGELKKGVLFLKKNNFHITGEQIWKTGESTYRVLNGTITSCDGEKVPWKIKAKEILVTIEGYGQLWQSSLLVRDIPALYVPYMIFPAKTKRQSGFLMPEPGISSRDGVTFNLPFFWAISDNTDATFNEYFMSRRGLVQGAEFRYALSPFSKGTLMLDYLFKDYGSEEQYKEGNISQPYTERYWFRSKINQRLPWDMDLKMDLDLVSDIDYLNEFQGTPNGLNRNRLAFLSDFGRDLGDQTQLSRTNTAALTKNFGSYSFTGGFTYYQQLANITTALDQLPYARFDGIKQVLWKDLYYQWGSSYNYYWAQSSDTGHVVELTPTLYYPTKLGNYLKLEGSMGMTEDLYQVTNKLTSSTDYFGNRSVPSFTLDMSTDIEKIFQLSGEEFQKLKHDIRPQIVYNYTPQITQDTLPSFISPINQNNSVTYYLYNTFTGKSLLGKGGQGEDLFSYPDLVQLKLYQTYNITPSTTTYHTNVGGTTTPTTTTINNAGTTIITTTNSGGTTTTTTTPSFSDVVGELELTPHPNLSLRSSVAWSPYTGQVDSQSYDLILLDKKGNRAFLEYLSTLGGQTQQINANLTWKINSLWSATFQTNYSLDQNISYGTYVGLTYTKQCWGIRLSYSYTLTDTSFMIYFTLKGLGEF